MRARSRRHRAGLRAASVRSQLPHAPWQLPAENPSGVLQGSSCNLHDEDGHFWIPDCLNSLHCPYFGAETHYGTQDALRAGSEGRIAAAEQVYVLEK